MILQCSAAELFHGVEPIFDAANYFVNTPHDPSCRIAHNLKNLPLGVGEVRLVRIEQPINSTHHLDMLKWAKASAADSLQENDVVVTGLFLPMQFSGNLCIVGS